MQQPVSNSQVKKSQETFAKWRALNPDKLVKPMDAGQKIQFLNELRKLQGDSQG